MEAAAGESMTEGFLMTRRSIVSTRFGMQLAGLLFRRNPWLKCLGKGVAIHHSMPEYSDPEKSYTISYPDGWLPLTHEGSPHVSLASLTTGGYLKMEACQFEKQAPESLRPDRALQSLIECEKRSWPQIEDPVIQRGSRSGASLAYMTFTRTEPQGEDHLADFGHTRAWIFSRG